MVWIWFRGIPHSDGTSSDANSKAAHQLWHALTKPLFDPYRPELHYMRGPGPKWHEKHDWVETSSGSPAVRRALRAGLQP
jgi:hypothetical protein